MIHRKENEGQFLNVEDLNRISVLVDRSETARTEVGINTWREDLNGPPHNHEAKEQIFYVLAGHGSVTVGSERFSVAPGDLVYVPAGAIHQTVTQGSESLSYFLFNAFLDSGKEGHASFADHIEKVKKIRKQQAEQQSASAGGKAAGPGASRLPRCIHVDLEASGLLDARDTDRSSVNVLAPTAAVNVENAGDCEQTILVVAGRGIATCGSASVEIDAGDVLFVPRGESCRVQPRSERFRCLAFHTRIQ